MVNVLLSTDSLTVLGGPTSVDVDVDLGASGRRGSLILAHSGVPSGSLINNVQVQIYDMVINILPGNQYLGLYQYLLVDGEPSWTYLLQLVNKSYVNKESRLFNDGYTSVSFPISDLVSYGIIPTLDIDQVSIQVSVQGSNPIAHSLSNLEIVRDDEDNAVSLDFDISGSILDPVGGWELLDSSYTVDILVSVT
jgi:hypothetical protein